MNFFFMIRIDNKKKKFSFDDFYDRVDNILFEFWFFA